MTVGVASRRARVGNSDNRRSRSEATLPTLNMDRERVGISTTSGWDLPGHWAAAVGTVGKALFRGRLGAPNRWAEGSRGAYWVGGPLGGGSRDSVCRRRRQGLAAEQEEEEAGAGGNEILCIGSLNGRGADRYA